MNRLGYRVTLRPVDQVGVRGGTATLWVASEERAREIVGALPSHREFCAVPWSDIPEDARANLERAEAGRS